MTILSRVYKHSGNEITFLNGQFFLINYVKIFSLGCEKRRARSRYVECTLTQFAISVLYVPPVTLHLSIHFTEAFR